MPTCTVSLSLHNSLSAAGGGRGGQGNIRETETITLWYLAWHASCSAGIWQHQRSLCKVFLVRHHASVKRPRPPGPSCWKSSPLRYPPHQETPLQLDGAEGPGRYCTCACWLHTHIHTHSQNLQHRTSGRPDFSLSLIPVGHCKDYFLHGVTQRDANPSPTEYMLWTFSPLPK